MATVFEKLTKDAHTLADKLDDICGCDCSTCPAFHHCAKYIIAVLNLNVTK